MDRDALAGLTFTDRVSVSWQAVESQPDKHRLALVNESNEVFLRAVSALSASTGDIAEDDVPASQELAKLDLKVNLLLDLVGQLLYQQLDIPERNEVWISSTQMQWRAEQLPRFGQLVFMQVYIQHGTPKPLCFFAEVVTSERERNNGIARVEYLGLGGSAQAWLDKFIFRHHRREVAFDRANSGQQKDTKN